MMHEDSRKTKAIDRFTKEKLYIQLTRIFLEEITSGRWKLNQRIPTEDDLCRTYHVSKITVRQAIEILVSDGYLTKVQGKGTFVTSVLPVVGLAMRTGLTETLFGKEVSAERELLYRGTSEPPAHVRSHLKTDTPIYRFLSRRMAEGAPAYIEDSFIPTSMLPDIERIDLAQPSFYLLLQEKAIKKIFKIIQTVEVSRTTGELASHLDLGEGAPIYAVHRLFISSDETPVAYSKIEGRSDRYKHQTILERIR